MTGTQTEDLSRISCEETDLKDSFWTMVVHDMKGPVQAEIYALKLLLNSKNENLTDMQREILSDILSSTEYLKSLIYNVMQKCKTDCGNFSIVKEKNSFKNLVTQCCKEVKYISEERGISIVLNYQSSIKYFLFDYEEIKRVINNLLTNGIKYSYRHSQIIIDITNNKSEINFSVTNNGAGIAPEFQDKIFEKFISYSLQRKSINTGLGLYISKQIIKAHGGNIQIKSIPQEYTTISFTLPL